MGCACRRRPSTLTAIKSGPPHDASVISITLESATWLKKKTDRLVGPAERLNVLQQVSSFLRGQVAENPVRHQRLRALLHLSDRVARNRHQHLFRGLKDNCLLILLHEQPLN